MPMPPKMSLGSPSPVGPPAPPMMGMPPGGDDDAGAGILSPETIGYHDDPRNCGNCKHNQGGTCELTSQQIADEGGCRVWEGGGDQMSSPEGMSPEGMSPNPDASGGGAPAGGGRGMYGS